MAADKSSKNVYTLMTSAHIAAGRQGDTPAPDGRKPALQRACRRIFALVWGKTSLGAQTERAGLALWSAQTSSLRWVQAAGISPVPGDKLSQNHWLAQRRFQWRVSLCNRARKPRLT
jgi:hypothetical protein